MKIIIGSDHRGYELKKGIVDYLRSLGHEVNDVGPYSKKGSDYPVFGRKVAGAVSGGRYDRGILICGSGIGMSMVGNRVNARAALCRDLKDAESSRMHNDSNILVLSADRTPYKEAEAIANAWLNTGFEGGRHLRRVLEIDDLYTMVGVSLLSKDTGEMTLDKLVNKVKLFEDAGVDEFHFDVIDGKYNVGDNNWEYQGPDAIKALRGMTELPFMAHLMINDPIDHVEAFANAGCDAIVFHYETYKDDVSKISDMIRKIRSCNMQAGIALEPDTPVDVVFPYLDDIDRVLIMTVKTGFAGQQFIDKTDKMRVLADKRKGGYDFWIAVDGGIDDKNGRLCRDAGANMLYAASYIQNSDEPASAINSLRGS